MLDEFSFFMLQLKTFKGGYDDNFSYVLFDSDSREACIIDTAIDPKILKEYISDNELELKFVVIMHSHFDHVIGFDFYRKHGLRIFASEKFPQDVDKRLVDGDELFIGDSVLKVISTPGHIEDCICILVEGKLFTTDTLFIDGCGRCDLAGADVNDQYESLYNKILKLPDSTVIYPGHDYGDKPFDTLGEQKKSNHFLTAKNKEEFVKERMG
jgi:glyoxylase-like metal-dependent hydrolase (beta-lactamase superfamily II)